MSSTITATLKRNLITNDSYCCFIIRGEREMDLDTIFIEKKVPRKHRDKACWSVYTHYKAKSIGFWLFRLNELGFDTTEFEQGCIEMGWEKEVNKFKESVEKGELNYGYMV